MKLKHLLNYLIVFVLVCSCKSEEHENINRLLNEKADIELFKYYENQIDLKTNYSFDDIADSVIVLFTPTMCTRCKETLLTMLRAHFSEQVDHISIIIFGMHRVRELHHWDFNRFDVYICKGELTEIEFEMGSKPLVLMRDVEKEILKVYAYDKHKLQQENVDALTLFFY